MAIELFSEFLNEIYQTALMKRSRAESIRDLQSDNIISTTKNEQFRCYSCKEVGHKSPQCPKDPKNKNLKSGNVTAAKTEVNTVSNNADNSGSEKKENKEIKCPCCKGFHTYKPYKSTSLKPSSRFSTCPEFLKLDLDKRGEVLEQVRGCIICTSWLHGEDKCRVGYDKASCKQMENGVKCSKKHSSLLHGCSLPYCISSVLRAWSSFDKEKYSSDQDIDEHTATVMLIQDVPAGNAVTRTQWDSACNKILVTHNYAKKAGFKEIPAEYYMQVVGKGWDHVKDKIYIFDITDKNGKSMKVWGYGIEKITDPVPPTDLSPVRSLFPHIPDGIFEPLDEKPLDILVGMNFFGLHPSGGLGKNMSGNLKALKSDFSKGWVIGGSHPLLRPSKIKLTEEALAMTIISRVEINPFTPKDFWEMDNLGVQPPKKCGRCKSCKLCSEENTIISCQEEEEFRLIDKGVTVKDGKTKLTFPFIKNPNVLSNNRVPMLRRSQKLEQNLQKRGLLENYNTEFNKFLERNVISEVSQEELDSYGGPKNYISHHGVLQPWKITTPLRIVSNSSQDNYGHSLNSCLPKGPNCLSDMYKIQLGFRSHPIGLAFDISKAYHSITTGPIEKYLRLMIWRLSPDEEWRTYGYEVLAFGDRVASGALEAAKRKCAEMGDKIDPIAAKRIRTQMYVDDGATGGTREEVERFIGKKNSSGEYDGTIQEIFKLGGFSIKSFVQSGCTDNEAMKLLGNSVLGYFWDAKNDIMGVKLKVNLSKKKRKIAKYPDLTIKDLDKLNTIKLTKRNLLGVLAGTFDSIGIATPYTIKLKIGLKALFD